MTTKMSLHRVIAEIKALEAFLATVQSAGFVYQSVGDDTTEHAAIKAKSQGLFDKYSSAIANLAALKTARNLANSTVAVTIGGVSMTIDAALAKKAALPHKKELIRVLQAQFTNGQRAVETANQQVETRIAQQLSTMFTGTRKATEDEVKVIRASVERVQKAGLIHADGLKDRIEALTKEVTDFTTEVDYTLSEANATNTVEVNLT